MKILSLIFLAFSWNAFAQFNNQTRVGVGAAKNASDVNVLVQINSRSAIRFDQYQFMIVSFKGSGQTSNGEVQQMDIELRGLGFEYDWDEYDFKGKLGANVINFKYQKDIYVDQDQFHSLSILGVYGDVNTNINKDVKIYVKAALDFLGVAIGANRISDDVDLNKHGINSSWGFDVEVGVTLIDKITIRAGVKGNKLLNDGYSYRTGRYNCDEYYTSYGSRLRCEEERNVHYTETWYTERAYIEIAGHLTKNLSVFAAYSRQKFRTSDEVDPIPGYSKSVNHRFEVGARYTIPHKRD